MGLHRSISYIVFFLTVIKCDLPVHCVKHQIVGEWQLQLGRPELKGHGPLTCGHRVPDEEQTSYLAYNNKFHKISVVSVFLSGANMVFSGRDRKGDVGKWTMVYDEGFEVQFQGIKYFAFSKYVPSKEGGYSSLCSETLVGWYTNLNTGERGCYRGIKHSRASQMTDRAHNGHVVQPKLLEINMDTELGDIVLTKEFQDEVIDKLMKAGVSWTPRTYGEWEGMTFSQINRRGGNPKLMSQRNSLIEQHETEGSDNGADTIIQAENSLYNNFSLEDVADLPKSFSWEKYLVPVRAQKDCGSCYTIATMSMLSARLRIQGHNVNLSPQYSLDCNYYNQGCNGGYPYLVNKFANEQYLVDENSYPYTGLPDACRRDKVMKEQKTLYSVKSYHFVGGAYGNSSERKIMEEIRAKGPVVLNFEPEFDFMFYGGGVYHSVDAADWILQGVKRPEWEKVDHSVLCYGWGEEDGQKYWLLQNSWGEDWGDRGFFKMRRGTDESAIESMAEAGEPIVVKNKLQPSFLEHNNHIQ